MPVRFRIRLPDQGMSVKTIFPLGRQNTDGGVRSLTIFSCYIDGRDSAAWMLTVSEGLAYHHCRGPQVGEMGGAGFPLGVSTASWLWNVPPSVPLEGAEEVLQGCCLFPLTHIKMRSQEEDEPPCLTGGVTEGRSWSDLGFFCE